MLNNLVLGAIGLNVLALIFVVLRARIYRTSLYRPMILNIGLSIAPIFMLIIALFAVTFLTSQTATGHLSAWVTISGYLIVACLWLAWLLMLPNSSYLITELNLSHRQEQDPVPLWFDIILVLTLAISGVTNMVINIGLVQIVYAALRFPDSAMWASLARPESTLLALGIIALCAVGMYLGRYLRLNSWDIKHPVGFLRRLVKHFDSVRVVRNAAGFVLAHTIFIALVYYIIMGGIITAGGMLDALRAAI